MRNYKVVDNIEFREDALAVIGSVWLISMWMFYYRRFYNPTNY